jgi:hypothetical protein
LSIANYGVLIVMLRSFETLKVAPPNNYKTHQWSSGSLKL